MKRLSKYLPKELPHGKILGKVKLVNCIKMPPEFYKKYLTKYQLNVKIVSINTKEKGKICKGKGFRMSIYTSKYTNHTREAILFL